MLRTREYSHIAMAIMAAALIATCPYAAYADSDISVVDSPEAVTQEVSSADSEAFFNIDTRSGKGTEELATEDLTREADRIIEDSGSAKELAGALEESGLYRAEPGRKEVQVTSLFANRRIRLTAGYAPDLDTFGATSAAYYKDHYLLGYASIEETRQAYEALRERYGESAVVLDIPMRLNDLASWGTAYMGLDKKLDMEQDEPVTVAVIDTGIDREHEIFSGRTIEQGYDFANGDEDPYDDNAHGTSVAGIIAGATPKSVGIMPLKVMKSNGDGSLLDFIYALEYAGEHGADIVNISLGTYCLEEDYLQFEQLYKDAASEDLTVVVSAGNEETDLDEEDIYEFPAELPGVICVSAFGEDGQLCDFSNYGSSVDFSAPGEKLRTAEPDQIYAYAKGTSFSAPYIAAAAAVIKTEKPGLTPGGIEDRLIAISEDMGEPGKDPYYGNGCPVFTEEEPSEPSDPVDPTDPDEPSGPTGSAEPSVPTEPTYPAESTDPSGPSGPETPDTPSQPIEKKQIGDCSISGIQDAVYSGQKITQNITVTYDGEALTEGTDYTVRYSDNTDAGTASIIITGMGDYEGEGEATFRISPKKVSPDVTLSRTEYRYSGKVRKPSASASIGGKKLTDYTVTYPKGRKNAGTYTVKLTLRGNYRGTGRATFIIRKAASRLTAKSRKVTVSYKNLRKKTVRVDAKKAMIVKGSSGKVRYTKLSGNRSITVNKKTGRITVKKGLKKGTYRISLSVHDPGDKNHSRKTRVIKVTVKVR